MFYLYLLQSQKNGKLYIGQTIDLKKRLIEHNNGKSQFTKLYRPWNLIYYEAYLTLALAKQRESQLKRFAKSYAMLKKRLDLI